MRCSALKNFANLIVRGHKVILVLMIILCVGCALLIPSVEINTDMTKYLPDDSSMKQGVDVMMEDFTSMAMSQTIRVMFEDLTDEEKAEIKRQIVEFKKYYNLIQFGDYYRLSSPFDEENSLYCAWEVAREDGSEALVCAVRYGQDANSAPETFKVKGLCPNKFYRINGSEEKYLGQALMTVGIRYKYDFFSYPSNLYHITLA